MKHRSKKHILWFREVGIKDVPRVGGKNASLGEMMRELGPRGVRLPDGFAITAGAYRYFIKDAGLLAFIKETLQKLDTHNLKDLARRGKLIRETIKSKELPKDLKREIIVAYRKLEKKYGNDIDVAVRSSATAEDLPGASFAGQQETYLGVRGEEDLLRAVKSAMASLFTNRAISYRVDKGFDQLKVALSVGVQRMVRSDKGASGVMFSIDTESGFRNAVLINASWGLGEMVVQGSVTPDEYLVFKPTDKVIDKKLGEKAVKMIYAKGAVPTKIVHTSKKEQETFVLKEKEIIELAVWAKQIEEHYTKKHKKWTPMDMEWAKDGRTGELFIVQARPETVHAARDISKVKEYILERGARRRPGSGGQAGGTAHGVIVKGASVGSMIATGRARIIMDAGHIHEFKKGEILVTGITNPDWEPIMKIASAIVTDKGGRTSHAAIVSRELGIPAVVGTGNATKKIKTGMPITVDTTGSEGKVLRGIAKFKILQHDVKKLPKPKTHIMINVAMPETAFETSFLPNKGVGLAREEFIIASKIGIHPLALIDAERRRGQGAGRSQKLMREIEKRTRGWKNKTQFYVDNLAYGIARIGAAFHPYPVIVRFSDFKTNEYRTLLGGDAYEPKEENPMIGWRGASRYYDPKFREAFKLECLAIKKVRDEIGLTNVIPMVPFCRTVEEGKKVIELMAKFGLKRVQASRNKTFPNPKSQILNPLKIYVMCEIPSNVLLAKEFLKIFDGMSIGSNDLTQLTLGLDRDSGIVSGVGNENDPAVKELVRQVIRECKKQKKYIGICGQAPSDHPEFAEFLVEEGIESMSLNPDTVIKTTIAVAEKEKMLKRVKRA